MKTLITFNNLVLLTRSFKAVILLSVLTACSGGGDSSSTTPASSNNAPVANVSAVNAIQDTDATITLLATDADGDTLTYSLDTQAQNGMLALSGNTVTYTPNTDFSGSDSFTFKANDGSVDSNAATVTITVAPVSSVSGIVSKTDGSVIDGVMVQIVDANGVSLTPQTSSALGKFEVKAKTSSDLILSFTKAGYAKQTKTITAPSVKNLKVPMNITMLEAGVTHSVDNSVAAQVSGTNGSSVSFPANSFVDASGNPVSGNIDVVITPVDVSDRSILAAFPGEFAGISETTNDRVNIVSGGTTYFDFSQNGAPLQLANGSSAEIELPLFVTNNPVTGNPVELGDTIELWYLNETTGVWVQEGTGTVVVNNDSPTGYALKATVSHFTPWNIDWPFPDFSMLDITINGTVNGGVATLKTRTTGMDWGWLPSMTPMIVGTTQTYSIFPWSGETCVWLEYTDNTGAAATSPEQCLTNIVSNTTYALTFNIETAGSLVLYNGYSRSSYRINQTPYIYFGPRSLESSVSYAVTAGALPPGMSLSAYNSTHARITGSSTALGSYSFTVQGTDSDGFTDTRTVSFDIVNPPPPSLHASTYIHANTGEAISQDISPRITNNTTAPISWTITQSDGSAVPAGVTISSAGVLSIVSFDGTDVVYKVRTYNIYGASNAMSLHVKGMAAPMLPSSRQIMFMQGMPTISETLSVLGTSAPATAWTITNMDDTMVDANQVSISNTGVVTFDNTTGTFTTGMQFKVKASNAVGTSNEMVLELFEDVIGGFCPDPTMDPITCLPF